MKAFRGRINRASYWANLGLLVAIFLIINQFFKSHFRIQEVVLAFICVPRLHDIGKTGWYFMGGVAVEIVGAIASLGFLRGSDIYAGLGLTAIGVAGLLILLGCIPGQLNANEFGDPPPAGIHFTARQQS